MIYYPLYEKIYEKFTTASSCSRSPLRLIFPSAPPRPVFSAEAAVRQGSCAGTLSLG